jgi:hypothetical protein
MINSTLGAPFGGTTWAGQYGLESVAFMLITPPKAGGGGGRYFPSMLVVALGEPGTPVVCWAIPGIAAKEKNNPASASSGRMGSWVIPLKIFMLPPVEGSPGLNDPEWANFTTKLEA